MRENSGSGKGGSDSRDPTLKDNAGRGAPGSGGGDFTGGASFEVAADRDPEGGERSPGKRGRGEVDGDDAVAPDNS